MRLVLEPLDSESPPVVVEGTELLVGRGIRAVRDEAPGSGLLDIDDGFTTVSREHACFRRGKGAWVVENLGKHGTTVNDQPLEEARVLADGDLLRFGRGGPRYRVRLRAETVDAAVRRCTACLEIVPLEEVDRHGRACPVLHPPRKAEPPVFVFGPLRSAKRNLVIVADLSGGPEGLLLGPGLIEALQETSIRFNVLVHGGAPAELWRGLRAATAETRAEARAWLREHGRRGGTPSLAAALARALEVKEAEAVVLLAAGEAEDLRSVRGKVEIHAIGLGPLYYRDSQAQAVLRDLAARHGGGFFAVAASS